MATRGKFIVIEGIDYAGKGTQMDLLRAHFPDFFYTREPGGSPLAEELRELVLRREGPSSNPVTDLFLFLAARASHVTDTIQKKLEEGTHVICDRYDSSTYAFQVFGEQRKELEPMFWSIREHLPEYYRPNAYIFLDLDAETAIKRSEATGSKKQTRFDIKPIDYHKRVHEGLTTFMERVKADMTGTRVYKVDASKLPEEVFKDMQEAIVDMIAF